MITLMAVFEDNAIVATRGERHWTLTLSDHFSSKCQRFDGVTDTEFAAIMALTIGVGEEETTPAEITTWLYEQAEKATPGISQECRPYP